MVDIAPPADDRTHDEPDDPGLPADLKALQALWRDRDMEYAKRNRALTYEQIEVIREGRRREAKFLPRQYVGRACQIANSWYPPEHGQGAL